MTELDIAALRALAGEAQANPDAAIAILDETGASANDCVSPHAQALWAVMESKVRRREALDTISISLKLPDIARQQIVDVLLEPAYGMARERFTTLRDESQRRKFVEQLFLLAGLANDKTQPFSRAVAESAKFLSNWSDETKALRTGDETFPALIDELEDIYNAKRSTVVETGIESLDAVIGGLQPTLTMVGALPGVGKSALVAGLCRNLAQRGVKVGLLSLEDEHQWLPRRLLAEAAGVPVFVLANRPMGNLQRERVLETAPALHNLMRNMLIDDRSGLTTADVVSSARRMIARGAKAIFVDHLGEIAISRTERHDLDITDVLRELRTIAKTYKVPVVVLCHLRRREGLGVDVEPKLTDFAFSSGVERMARVALGLFKSSVDGELRCSILKQTQGISGVSVTLQLNTQAAVVTKSEASDAARKIYGRDE